MCKVTSNAQRQCKNRFFAVHWTSHTAIKRRFHWSANESVRTNSTGPGKIVEPGHLVTPLHQTSLLDQNTFRCSVRLEQDIEVSRSIWLAELGNWGHSAKWKGNKIYICVVSLGWRMLVRKEAANCDQFKKISNAISFPFHPPSRPIFPPFLGVAFS